MSKIKLVRVAIPQHLNDGTKGASYKYRTAMSAWLRDNCWKSTYEYQDDYAIFPIAVHVEEEWAVVFKLMWAI